MITQYSYGLNTRASQNNNVIDIYKKWNAEEVRADLQKKRTDLVNIVCQSRSDLNTSCVIRSANAFLAKETYVVGRRRLDARGAVGMGHYETCFHADSLGEVVDKLHQDGYTVYAVDNIMEYNPVSLWDEPFGRKSAFIYGNESDGLSKSDIELADKMVYIAQTGAVRSMNVACAASCVMAEYSRRYRIENYHE